MSETILTISLVITIATLAAVLWFIILRQRKNVGNDQSLLLLQNQIQELNRTLDSKLSDSAKMLQQQAGQNTKIYANVVERLARLDETNKQVLNFSDQLRNLQDILKNPKQRGILGEYYLETLLKNTFQPKQYKMQYEFKDGTIVDAALFFGDKIIPIDSKFSLENYNRIVEEKDPAERERLEKQFKQDLKNRIDETAKYIRPQEGTMDLAFMFIPAEGIYYDLLVNQIGAIKSSTRDLVDYAVNEKRVHIVSPTTFYVALQSLVQSMRAYQIQESTKEILENVVVLGKHLKAYDDYFKKLGTHLGTTVRTYTTARKELGKIDKDVLKISGEAVGIEPLAIEGPPAEEYE